MAEGEAPRAEVATRAPWPACLPATVTVADSRSSASTPAQAAEIERHNGVVSPAQRLDPADDARAAAERDDRDRGPSARVEYGAQLVVAVGVEDGIRGLRGAPFAQAHEVGVALAGRMLHPHGVVVTEPPCSEQRAQLSPRRARQRRWGQAHRAERHRRPRRRQRADPLRQERERIGGQHGWMLRVAPPPPAHHPARISH